jgi:hypothetical protein
MNLNERTRNFPIRFYKTPNNWVEYESAYISGRAPDLNSAMNKLVKAQEDMLYDLYNYDDVMDVEIGQYEIADRPRKHKGREYLGQIMVKIEVTDFQGINTLKHVSKNPKDLKKHKDLVKMMAWDRDKRKFIQGLKEFFRKLNPMLHEDRRYTMDITKKYVLQFMHESAQKNEDELEMDANMDLEVPAEGGMEEPEMQDASVEMPAEGTELTLEEDASGWQFNPADQGMSECMTFYCPDTVVIEDTGFMNAGANVHSPDDNAEEFVGVDDADNTFLLLYCPGEKEAPYGFHFEMFEPGSLMVYDYAADIEELKEIVEHKFLRYTNFDIEAVPFAEFEAKIAEAQQPAEESAEVDEAVEDEEFLADEEGKNETSVQSDYYRSQLISMVKNDADLLLYYLQKHLSEDGFKYFYEYVKEEMEYEQKDIEDTTDAAFDNAEESAKLESAPYKFSMNCKVSGEVMADSQQQAQQILKNCDPELFLDDNLVEFEGGSIRYMMLDPDSLDLFED